MTNEEIYDAEIAPKLLELCKRCQELGFSFAANVEWELGNTGRTEFQSKDASAKQLLVHWAARCNGNVDALFMAIDKSAFKNGHSSAYLERLGNKNIKFTGNEVAAFTIISPKS